MKIRRFFKKLGVFVLIFLWFLSGWPPIWQNPRIPPEVQKAYAAVLCERPTSTTDRTGGNTTWDNNGLSWDTTGCSGGDTTTQEGLSNNNVTYDTAVDWNWSTSGNSYSDLAVKIRIVTSNFSKNTWKFRYTTNGTEPDAANGTVLNLATTEAGSCPSTSTGSTNGTCVYSVSISPTQNLTNLKVGFAITKGGGGGDSTADVQIYDVWVQGNEAAVVSVSVSDGVVSYGIMPENTSKTTLSGELNDMQTATNDGNVTENFNIKGQDAAGGGCTWTLAAANGSDQYIHQFCNDTDLDCSTPPTNYTALTTNYQALDTGIATSGTVNFQLRLTTPNPSSCYGQQSVDVTVQAVQP